MPVPAQNPITPQKAILGKLLFWEEQLSSNNRVACGTCHSFAAGGGDERRARNPGLDGVVGTGDDVFASPGLPRSDANNDYAPAAGFGFEQQVTDRQSSSFLTAAWFTELFWDGRASQTFVDPVTNSTVLPSGGALESQALAPILSSVEMAHDFRNWAHVTQKLARVEPMALALNLPADMAGAVANGATYPDLFQAAFGTPDITAARIGLALATYQRTLVPNQAPYDAFAAGNPQSLTPQQHNGFQAFNGPGRCNLCHDPGLFSDDAFHNLGLRPIFEDNGRQGVTNNPADAGRFKTPSLRNVGLRNSFMHNGEFTSLQQVMQFYRTGGGAFPQNKDPLLLPINLPPNVEADIVNFLSNALTDPRVAAGVAPFDRPTLRGQLVPEAGVQYGGSTSGTGGIVPQILAGVPANLGNRDFKIGLHNARGGAAATLLLSPLAGFQVLNGVQLNVGLNGSLLMVPWVLDGAPGAAGAGFGTIRVTVPDVPALSGVSLFSQWIVWDAGAANGAASTRGARIDLF
ncbi:MAG: hypothetical protein KAI24_00445 [Planctomycetes bacterium]|nr:hypothetical protein [Planctomycetota bacterium]